MFKNKSECDFSNPEEHFLWALRGMQYNGTVFLAPENVFRRWSEHLFDCGFVHVDYVRDMADEEGKVTVDQLPKQKIEFVPDKQSEMDGLTIGGRWKEIQEKVEEEDPELTPEQAELLIDLLKRGGYIDNS